MHNASSGQPTAAELPHTFAAPQSPLPPLLPAAQGLTGHAHAASRQPLAIARSRPTRPPSTVPSLGTPRARSHPIPVPIGRGIPIGRPGEFSRSLAPLDAFRRCVFFSTFSCFLVFSLRTTLHSLHLPLLYFFFFCSPASFTNTMTELIHCCDQEESA